MMEELFCKLDHDLKPVTAIRPKLCGNSAFPQNFHNRKLGGITAFYAMAGNFRKKEPS